MVTRLAHIGDIHLQHTDPRNPAKLKALAQITAGIKAQDVKGTLIPGDLFHQKSSPIDRIDLASFLIEIASVGPVVIVPGNHDQEGDLDIFGRLKTRWPVIVQTTPAVIHVALSCGTEAAIACLPYPTKAGLASLGVAPADVVPTAGQLLDTLFMTLGEKLSRAAANGHLTLFMGHINVAGAMASNGQPQIGHEIELDRVLFRRLTASVYNALNHVHAAQEIGGGVYAGSITAMNFGETEGKAWNLIECERNRTLLLEGSSTMLGWTACYLQQPIATPRLFHVTGRLTRDGFFPNQDAPLCERCDGIGTEPYPVAGDEDVDPLYCYACKGQGRRTEWSDAEVRVRYTYLASERAVLDVSHIERAFAGAARLKIEGIAESDREIRAPEVAAATTLEGKLAAYARVAALTESMRVKLALLEEPDAIKSTAAVATVLKAIEQPAPAETAVVAA